MDLTNQLRRGLIFELDPFGEIVKLKEERGGGVREVSIRRIQLKKRGGAFLRWESELLAGGDLLPFSRAVSCTVLSKTLSKLSSKLGLNLETRAF